MILIKNNSGTPGTNSENAIYGAEIKGDVVSVWYSTSTRDFRDAFVEVQTVDYNLSDYIYYLSTKKWELI